MNKKTIYILIFNVLATTIILAQSSNTVVRIESSKKTVPVAGEVISHYGMRNKRMHHGTDIRLKLNDYVYGSFDGTVTKAGTSKGYGFIVIIKHPNGLETYYAHLNKILVKLNQQIKSGDIIGKGGQTGRATTPHLHFEMRLNQKSLNPETYFDFEKGKFLDNSLTQSVSNQINAQNNTTSYIIKKGDTLSTIAKKHKTTVAKICQLNGISKTEIIYPGMKLIVAM